MLFVVKPTSSCNGACVYCSAWHDDPEDRHRMTEEDVDLLCGRVVAWAARARPRPRRVSLLWHGGEPLAMGKAFFRHVLRLTRILKERHGVVLRHLMQSNITLVDEEWGELLGELLDGRRLGSSYDPVPGIRLLKGGGDYEAQWKRGCRILRRAGLGVGVVCVVHRLHLGRAEELLQAFLDLGYEGGLRMNPLYGAGLAAKDESLHISPAQWGEFLWEAWEAWNRLGRPLKLDPLLSWERLARGQPTRLACAFSGNCTVGFSGIRADGMVFSCGRSMDGGVQPFGNLHEQPLEEILASEARRAFLNRAAWLRQGECSACRWWAFCHGGCPNDAHLTYGDPLRATGFCEGRRGFLERAFGGSAGVFSGSVAATPEEQSGGEYMFEVAGDEEKSEAEEGGEGEQWGEAEP